jgi:DNA repair protein SbcC/Rad50
MQIAHVGIRNLRSYRSADLELGPGTTLLTGDIGSGKTSLLYAVEMALFGFAEVDPGYLIRHGAKDAEVELTLTDGTHRWELRRRFVRRARKGRDIFEPTDNSLVTDGHRATYSATELRRRTIELLGFPDNPNPRAHSDVWRWAVYLAQERMRDVLDPDVDARMETVRKALGVEQYRLAGENARVLARSLQDRADDLADQVTRHRDVEEEMALRRREEALAREQIAALEKREQSLREEQKAARVALDEADVLRRAVESAREAVAHQEHLALELRRSIEQDQAAQLAARERLTRLEADRAAESVAVLPIDETVDVSGPLRSRREELLRQLGDLETLRGQASGVEEQLVQAAEQERELKARNAATLDQLALAREERSQVASMEPVKEPQAPDARSPAQLSAERNQLEEARRTSDRRLATAATELRELAELVQQGVCPRCHRPVEASEFETHRQEQEALVAQLQHEVDSATNAIQTAEAGAFVHLEFERNHERWEQLEARRRDLRERETSLQTIAAEEQERVKRHTAQRAALESRRLELSGRLMEVERVREELVRADVQLVEAEERARASAARRERLAALERQIPEVQAEISLRGRSAAERMGRAEEVQRAIEEGRNRLRDSAGVEDRWKVERRRADELGRTLEALLKEASGPRGRLAESSARLDELNRRLRERLALEQQVTHLRSLSEWIDSEFRNAMVELERRRLQQGRHQFERRFAQYFAALVEDPALSARVDETFAPWVDIGGQPTPAEALSGGERTALALAYRLALGRTVRDAGRLTLETLILDEPTDGFSQEQTLRMGDLLEELGLPQVILVSHERQLEGIADRVVRIRKQAGVSVIEEDGATAGSPAIAAAPVETPRSNPRLPARRRKIRRLTDVEIPESGDGSAQAR